MRYLLSGLHPHGDEQLTNGSIFVQATPQFTLFDAPLADQSESEPNDSAGAANAVSVSSTPNIVSAAIGSGTDLDYYSFTLASRSGVFFDIDSRETGLSATLDTVVTVYDSAGSVVQGANNNGRDWDDFTLNDTTATAVSQDSSLYLDLSAGSYVVAVSSNSSTNGSYQLKLTSDSSYTASVPAFTSLPGATDTLFLDFDGHSATDLWGTYSIAAYDLNGNAAEWTPLERVAIKTVWQRVAEDYSPFNINITTSYGGSFSDGVGFRQVIGNSNGSEFGYAAGTIGVAYLNSYASGGSGNNTAFTFGLNFTAKQSTESATGAMASDMALARTTEMANTSAHEFGHALGLKHYGGSNPQLNAIMHSPDFGLNRERFVSGNTKSDEPPVIFQNDVAVISNATNTFGYRADDFGNTRPAATVLSSGTGMYSASGIIAQVTDVDYFRFNGVGATTINLVMLERAGNLDGEINLYNSAGTLLASADGANLSASLTFGLPSGGDYYVEVKSDGGAGEIGQYGLVVSTTLPGSGAISGKVFRDANLNHTFEPGGGDLALSGVTVFLDGDGDGSLDVGESSTTSDGSGNYSFTGLIDGSYSVREVAPAGYVTNGIYTALISGGNTVANQNFGNFPILYTGGAESNTFTVRRNAVDTTKIEIVDSAAGITYSALAALIPSLTFQTGDGGDSLLIDSVNGTPLPFATIGYDGGNQTDTLTILGSAAADTLVINNASGGSVAVANVETATVNGNGGNDALTLNTGVTANVTFDGGPNTDTFTWNASANPDVINIGAASLTDGTTTQSYTNAESLIVNAGASSDSITVATTSSGPATTVDSGQAGDNISVNSASTVSVLGSSEVSNDTLTVAAGANATISWDGGNGTDSLTFNLTTGPDTVTITTNTIIGGGSTLSYTTSETIIVDALGGADVFNLNSYSTLGPASGLTLNGGDDDDTFNIGNGNLDPITGNVTVNGQNGTDAVVVKDNSLSTSDSYTITSTTFDRATFGALAYATAEGFTLNAENGNNTTTISSTAAGTPVTVNGNSGNDTLTISGVPSSAIIFNGGLSVANTDTLNVNAGTYTFNTDANIGTFALNVNVNNASAAVVFNSTQHLKALSIAAGSATIGQDGSRVVVTDTLSVTGGKFDLKDNDLIVKSGTLGTWNGSAYTGVTGSIMTGRGDGTWNGATGIVTSMSDATTGVLTTLAVATAGQLGISNFDNETVGGGAVLVKYTWGGDADLNGELDGDDYFYIDSNIFAQVRTYHDGDFNLDGAIDGDDYFVLDSNILYAQNSTPL